MRALPGGTVTFLFTDVEASTALLHELGSGCADELVEHRDAWAVERASELVRPAGG